jgi:Ser/Thr protein kinase RdoA (MazF antagonist)
VYFTSQFLSDQGSKYLEEVSTHLKNFLQRQSRTSSEFGLCHVDLVISNIRLTDDGEVTFFDFGNAIRTWRAFDLSVVHWSLVNRYKDKGEKLWEAFLQGYKSSRSLPKLLLENLAVFLVLRQIGFLGGNCASLPLRLVTEPFESGFTEQEMIRLKQLVELSGI